MRSPGRSEAENKQEAEGRSCLEEAGGAMEEERAGLSGV